MYREMQNAYVIYSKVYKGVKIVLIHYFGANIFLYKLHKDRPINTSCSYQTVKDKIGKFNKKHCLSGQTRDQSDD